MRLRRLSRLGADSGPIKTVHISSCMFNLTTGAHKLHKEFVKMKAGAYYYQPQTQLNDKEVICDDMKGAMTLNMGDDIITTWYMRDFPNWLNGLGHTRVHTVPLGLEGCSKFRSF